MSSPTQYAPNPRSFPGYGDCGPAVSDHEDGPFCTVPKCGDAFDSSDHQPDEERTDICSGCAYRQKHERRLLVALGGLSLEQQREWFLKQLDVTGQLEEWADDATREVGS